MRQMATDCFMRAYELPNALQETQRAVNETARFKVLYTCAAPNAATPSAHGRKPRPVSADALCKNASFLRQLR